MANLNPDVFQVKGGAVRRSGVTSILVIQFGDIGDVILSFPCIRALKESFPAASVAVAVHEKAVDLISGCRWADRAITAKKMKGAAGSLRYLFGFISEVRRCRFDLVVDLRTGDRGAILTGLTGARQRISFWGRHNTWWRNRMYSHLVMAHRHHSPHIVDYYLSLLGPFGIRPSSIVPVYDVSADDNRSARNLLMAEGIDLSDALVAVQPFSLWAYKEWPLERVAALIDWLQERYRAQVIITGGPDQYSRAEGLAARCNRRVSNVAGKTSLSMLAAILKQCAVAIGVDSAGCHIAAAVGTPTATIFGPSNIPEWAPRGNGHRIVHHHLPCIPCNQKGCHHSERSRCLEELDVSAVIAQIQSQLDDLLEKR